MNYEIIEAHIEYDQDLLQLVAVLWKTNDHGGVRATYCTNSRCGGYEFLVPRDKLCYVLLQKVAAAGMDLPDKLKKKFFPGKRQWTH